MFVRTTFSVCRGTADYSCTCSECKKSLRRKVAVEHTVNPYNTRVDGEPKTRSEVYADAYAEARRQAAELEGSEVVCRDCEEAPNHALLMEFAAEPERFFPEPVDSYRGPWGTLHERKQIEKVWDRCNCCQPCCIGHRPLGWRITRKGLQRAQKLEAKAA